MRAHRGVRVGSGLLIVMLAASCVGVRGTRKRAYLIDTALTVIGTAGIVASVEEGSFDGLVFTTAIGFFGALGLTLTALGQAGEALKTGRTEPLVAVRPWVPTHEQVPYQPLVGAPSTTDIAVEVARVAGERDCPRALSLLDSLYRSAPDVHAALVRDPAVAGCIIGGSR